MECDDVCRICLFGFYFVYMCRCWFKHILLSSTKGLGMAKLDMSLLRNCCCCWGSRAFFLSFVSYPPSFISKMLMMCTKVYTLFKLHMLVFNSRASLSNSSMHQATIKTRMLQLQATVKRFQFDLYVNLEGQHMLISSWFQK